MDKKYLPDHEGLPDFGTLSIGEGGTDTDQIDLSTANVYKILTGVRREILKKNGQNYLNKSVFIWRPETFEVLEQFALANGYSFKKSSEGAMNLFGATHQITNDLPANHIITGVPGFLLFDVNVK